MQFYQLFWQHVHAISVEELTRLLEDKKDEIKTIKRKHAANVKVTAIQIAYCMSQMKWRCVCCMTKLDLPLAYMYQAAGRISWDSCIFTERKLALIDFELQK